LGEGVQKNIPAWKVLRQWPHVLHIEVLLREGKSLGSEEGKRLGSGLVRSRRKKFSRHFTVYDRIGRAPLG
jgi:hypothetical protein